MSYRCIHCGSFTGDTMAEAQAAEGHGVGVCVSACHYCNEGVMHAPHVCSNVKRHGGRADGAIIGELPPRVRDFVEYHAR